MAAGQETEGPGLCPYWPPTQGSQQGAAPGLPFKHRMGPGKGHLPHQGLSLFQGLTLGLPTPGPTSSPVKRSREGVGHWASPIPEWVQGVGGDGGGTGPVGLGAGCQAGRYRWEQPGHGAESTTVPRSLRSSKPEMRKPAGGSTGQPLSDHKAPASKYQQGSQGAPPALLCQGGPLSLSRRVQGPIMDTRGSPRAAWTASSQDNPITRPALHSTLHAHTATGSWFIAFECPE